jgi:dihydroorotate dehydrogenase/NAD-dependent dihydropyrimidine dehydrogenase PreA subunit
MYAERGVYNFNPSDKRNDLDEGLELVRKAREATDIVIWANMAGPGEDIDGWIKLAKALEQAGAHALELNFNCPNFNVKPGAAKPTVGAGVGKNPELAERVAAEVKKSVSIPVFPKISTDVPDIIAIYKCIERSGVDGIVINGGYLGAPPIDIFRGGKPKIATMKTCSFGGTCGTMNRPYSNRFVALCAQNTKLTIAGGGGIEKWQDAVESIMFGATWTTMCSKLLWDGYPYLEKTIEGLVRFMDEQGYESLGQMKGLALKTLVTNDALEYDTVPPQINEAKCIGCGVCERIGSCKAISIVNKKASVNTKKCVVCGLCASLCPKQAISF